MTAITILNITILNNNIFYGENIVLSLELTGNDVSLSNNGIFTLIDNLSNVYLSVTSNVIPANFTIINPGVSINNITGIFTPSDYTAYTSSMQSLNVIINQKYLTFYANDKIYDGSTNIIVTVSGVINNNFINYYASFPDYNAQLNKLINIGLVNDISNIYINVIPNYFTVLPNYFTISGIIGLYSFQNGIYNVLSSDINPESTFWNIFNYNQDYNIFYWQAPFNNSSTVLVNTTVIYGEWVQLQLPYQLLLTDYLIINQSNNQQRFYIVGSNDISNWYLVDSQNSTLSGIFYVASNISYYYYYRLIITSSNFNIMHFELHGNYKITYPNNYQIGNILYANIFQKQINPTFTVSKYYDGLPNAIINYTLSGIYIFDYIDLSKNIFGLYRDINANNNILVDISNISLIGVNSLNYSIINYITVYGNILQKTLQVFGLNKLFDKTNNVKLYLYGQISSDNIYIIRYDASYNNVNIGKQNINYRNLTLSGIFYNNYILPKSRGITYGIIFSNNKTYNIRSIDNANYSQNIWSLESYLDSCYISFNFDNRIYVGLSEQVNNTGMFDFALSNQYYQPCNILNNHIGYYFYLDQNNNIYIVETNASSSNTFVSQSYGINNNSKFMIYYDGININYYQDNILLKISYRYSRVNLYLNISFGYINQTVTNISFVNIHTYYYGGNDVTCDGLQGNNTINDLSGTLIYSGTSQGAYLDGRYTIVPSGLSSMNYNIRYITGYLNIKTSIK